MIAYYDTSLFVKLFVSEDGSTATRLLWARTRHALASTLLYPETRAAVAKAASEGRVSSEDDVLPRMDRLVGQVALVTATRALLWRAGELASKHRLRGYDAVHLASGTRCRGAGHGDGHGRPPSRGRRGGGGHARRGRAAAPDVRRR